MILKENDCFNQFIKLTGKTQTVVEQQYYLRTLSTLFTFSHFRL